MEVLPLRVLVTGSEGFLGRHVCARLAERGHEVVPYDISVTTETPDEVIRGGNILDSRALRLVMTDCDAVFHLAANASVRGGFEKPTRDLTINTVGTSNVLEAMRATGVRRIVFASSGSVYGNPTVSPSPENAPFPIQVSLYAASKVAGEALCSAYSEGYQFVVTILRFASMLGPGYARGHVFDFYQKLKADPTRLVVLGDPNALRSYVDVRDAARAAVLAFESGITGVEIYNVAHDHLMSTMESASVITAELGLDPEFIGPGGESAFLGDNPRVNLATQQIKALGWKPQHTPHNSVQDTVKTWEEKK